MIKINFSTKNDEIIGFESKGHAGYREYGQDIVCSAVSILVINTINAIETFTTDDFTLEENEKAGLIMVNFEKSLSDQSKLLLDTLVLGLKSIENEYGNQYINISIKEV
ncbi:hypothetical protein EDC19_0561 [Natranaerovirga hydrolytica]|uniref:Ribosomal processing cysteine protease Prp n=1 Tax=Natranaerovirga hydrolytica TaxID=680378 RepID=A0A4R1N689_9FIRM|nr:ribosomal-processing cysteine protease Prp [Natranaerovirga hydrolytica]TCK98143.1 hypothetical protein EDC19_0561 [Natranaerovirga hydrolytica]